MAGSVLVLAKIRLSPHIARSACIWHVAEANWVTGPRLTPDDFSSSCEGVAPVQRGQHGCGHRGNVSPDHVDRHGHIVTALEPELCLHPRVAA